VGAPLACTVRDCGLLLEPEKRRYACARRHSYDVARAGYLNLLQPQDRKSSTPGDNQRAVEARARLLAANIGRGVLDRIVQHLAAAALPNEAVAVDLGSGSGELLAELSERRSIVGIGVDISTAAAEYAARRFPAILWVVANADRRLPVLDCCADAIVSLHGRRNPADCARALTSDGLLIVAVPAADDLIELRATVLGASIARERAAGIVAEHEPLFQLVEALTVRESHRLRADSLRDLLQGTYRAVRTKEALRAETLQDMQVTLASELLVFRRSRAPDPLRAC
jgi:23S rRNA (guanine745-N1)-methyltransferase